MFSLRYNLSKKQTLYRFFCLLLLFTLGLPGVPTVASNQEKPAKLQSYLVTVAAQEPNERLRVIIQLAGSAPDVKQLIQASGGHFLQDLSLINAVVAEVPAQVLPMLAQLATVRHISLDAPVVKLSESTDGLIEVRDNFDQPAYNNNDGESVWAGVWQEIGEEDGPQVGDIAITPFWGGALQGLRLQGAERGAQRQVDLQQATAATLTLAYRRKAFITEQDIVTAAVSIDGGATWQEIARLGGPATDAEIQYAHVDLTAFAGTRLTIQVRLAATTGSDAKFYLDSVALQWTPRPEAVFTPSPKVYLPFAAEQAATVGVADSAEGSVQAALYNTAALASAYIKAIGADRLWTEAPLYLTGQGVTVAVVDSGITDHPDLKRDNGQSRVLARVTFVQDGKSPDDYYGHGTHVAGIIGGNGRQSGGKYMGVAPDVNLLDVKVTDDQGVGKMSDVVAGLQWVLNNKKNYNIKIANLSLNSTVPDSYHVSPLSAAVEILWFNGITVIVSAGNDGSYRLNSPANDPFVITVGAVDDKGTADISDDQLAKFSAYNITEDGFAKPDLVAPGRNLVALLSADDNNLASKYPDNKLTGSESTAYYKMSGTSMASAVVAGATALLLQKEPNLNPDQVKYRLMNTVKPFSTAQGCATGAGYLDIYAATKTATINSANTGVRASRLLWSGIEPVTWNSVSWNSVSWNSVSWNSVSWNSVSWNSVSWNSVSWNSNSTVESAQQYSCYDIDPTGLLGYWRMDETNGALIADASGNNNVGQFSTRVNRESSGKRNGAVELSGGVIQIANPTNLNTISDQLTVSLWVKRTQDLPYWRALVSRQYGNSWGDQFTFGIENGYYTFGVNTVNRGHQETWGGTSPLHEWVHLAGVYDGSRLMHYLNGALIDSKAVSGNLYTDAKPLFIGGNVNEANPYAAADLFSGQVDDVRIYRRALTLAEISILASNSIYNPGTFYRGINLNGNAVTIDGRQWEGGNAANLSSGPYRFCNQNVTLLPPTDSARATMIRCSIWGKGTPGARVTVSAVPNGAYLVYLYVWEDNHNQSFTITLNGETRQSAINSGAAGAWQKLGPWPVTVTSGQIKLESSGGDANFSGIEIWRQ